MPLTRAQAHHIRQLKSKRYRFQHQAFIIEGKKSVYDLLQSDYTIQLIIGTPQFWEETPHKSHQLPFPTHTIPAQTLANISTLKKNHHVLAIAQTKPNEPLTINPKERALVLDTIKDPGNLGTIMRIADWYGIKKIICSPTTVDPYNNKVIQSSMGSFTHIQTYYTPLKPFLQTTNLPIIGALLQTPNYLHHLTLPKQGLLIIGNESRGIHPDLHPLINIKTTIQGYGKADSLNAAIATAILCQNWCTLS